MASKYVLLFFCICSVALTIEVNTEAEPSAGGNGLEAVLQGPGAALSLLLDIRDLLAGWSRPPPRQQQQQHQEEELEAWRPALEDHRKATGQTLDILNESLERISSGVTQKVDLVMESFAALKMLVQAQEAHLQRLQSMVEKVQGTQDGLDDRTRDFRLSLEALETRLPKEGQGTHERNPEEFQQRILFVDDKNVKNNGNIKSADHSGKQSSLEKDLQTCLHEVKNEVASIKVQITNKDINTTSASIHKPQDPTINRRQDHIDQSNTSKLETIVNNLERIQTQQQVSLNTVNYKVSMVDDIAERVENMENATSHLSSGLGEVQDKIEGLSIDAIKQKLLENIMVNVTDLNKDIENIKDSIGSTGDTKSVVKKGLCVHPYKRGAGGCFYVHTSSRLGWRHARDHCRTVQGDLAAPGNFTQFKNYLLSQRLTRSYTYWLGASDLEEENVWKWVDGSRVDMGTSVWQSGQPNAVGTQSNCMEVKPAYKYVAADVTCKAQNYFICEQER